MKIARDLVLTCTLAACITLGMSSGVKAAPEKNESPVLAACPDMTLGEVAEDCPWAAVARAMIAEAEGGKKARVGAIFQKHLPDLDRALRTDAHRAAWKALWGRSINYDELAKGIIVHPAIIEALAERFGTHAPMVLTHFTGIRAEKFAEDASSAKLLGKPSETDPAGHPLVHAGMEHTYGYLFSVLKTSFGYKRARWVQGEIERGFGLKAGLLGPRPETGTLFANATWFAGHIAFRGNEGRLTILRNGGKDLAPELREFDFNKLAPIRLEETVEAKDSTGDVRKVVLRTDLVPFFHPQQPDSHLLVYSIEDPANGGLQLITAFPVASSFVDMVKDPANLGDNKPVQTRYNGFVEGVTGQTLTGTRRLAGEGIAK